MFKNQFETEIAEGMPNSIQTNKIINYQWVISIPSFEKLYFFCILHILYANDVRVFLQNARQWQEAGYDLNIHVFYKLGVLLDKLEACFGFFTHQGFHQVFGLAPFNHFFYSR